LILKPSNEWKFATTIVREAHALKLASSFFDGEKTFTLTSPATAFPERKNILPRSQLKPTEFRKMSNDKNKKITQPDINMENKPKEARILLYENKIAEIASVLEKEEWLDDDQLRKLIAIGKYAEGKYPHLYNEVEKVLKKFVDLREQQIRELKRAEEEYKERIGAEEFEKERKRLKESLGEELYDFFERYYFDIRELEDPLKLDKATRRERWKEAIKAAFPEMYSELCSKYLKEFE
jgi:hypothetical protein